MVSQQLTVALNGLVVGQLEKRGGMTFRYDESWLARPGARAISLSLPLQTGRVEGDVVYNFFDNLLPDNERVRGRIQARFHTPTRQPFDLLSSIGSDCVGAIQLYPTGTFINPVTEIHADPLSEPQIAALLRGYQYAPLGMEAESDDFRISLAGAQEKTALLRYRQQWYRPRGSTPTSHIFKLPVGYIVANNIDLSESCENEWLCLQLARAFGFRVPDAEIAHFDDQKALIVERFDRRWSQDGSWLMRLPQEDFCQALGVAPALKYESDGGPGIAAGMKLLLGSQQAIADRETFFRSQILFWLLAAIDGHAKNFSLFLEPGSAYRLAPLYDILSAYPLMTPSGIAPQKAKMAMAVRGKNRHFHWATILPRHYVAMAKSVAFSATRAADLLEEMAAQTDAVITRVERHLPNDFPAFISDPIFSGLRKQAQKIL
jgi:serine/threonine-protein kinase HipA